MEQPTTSTSSSSGLGGAAPPAHDNNSTRSKSTTPRPESTQAMVDAIKGDLPVKSDSNTDDKSSNIIAPSSAVEVEGAQGSASKSATPQPAASANANVASTSESASKEQSTEPVTADNAATYGTRSRNRSDGRRINYAEDQDAMDFEYSAPQKAGDSKRTAAPAEATSTSTKSNTQDTISKIINVNKSTSSKDSTPVAVTAPATNGKKRKAATAASTPPQAATSSTTSNAAMTTATSTRRAAGSVSNRPETNTMTFTTSKAKLNKDGDLVADDGATLSVNDHVYLVCEPPGDPYYLCRIMEFLHVKSGDKTSPVEAIRVNWFYRPRDVQRYNNDTRLVYGTMHSDVCPITSLRGKCQILHRAEIADLDEYRKGKDCFWFSQIFDRFIRRFYEVVPTSQIINVPDKVKRALDDRWKYIAVETGRVKELTSAIKLCKRCSQYCASHDSVDCAICSNSYHMACVNPPLPKKPSRGFAWACGPCGRAQEKKLQARHTPQLGAEGEEEIVEEEEEDPNWQDSTRAATPDQDEPKIDNHPGTQAEIAMAKMWPMRYLGIHCRVEDALQYDDRAIYPRASSRLGPRHQANTNVWHGRPVELVKPAEIKKKYVKTTSHKKDAKLSKETLAAIEADRAERAKRPKWVLDEPAGYVHRGEDYANDDPRNTAQLIFKMPDEDDAHTPASNEKFIDNFMERAKELSPQVKVAPYSVNFQDKALSLLIENKYDTKAALAQLAKIDRGKDLKEPILTSDDLKKFEDGVSKYGSEHRLVKQHMKTQLPISTIIRFYYLWKKTPRGRTIWDNYGGRKGSKKKNQDAPAKLQAEVANDADDSAFDSQKAATHKREFQCKFCHTKHSRQWRRAPGVSPGQLAPPEGKGSSKDKTPRPMLALCLRCAGLWRRYAIQWEDLEEVAKKVAASGGRAWKRRIDEELLRELQAANDTTSMDTTEAAAVQSVEAVEPPKKKTKTEAAQPKAKPVPPVKQPTPPPPPIVPDQPRRRDLPCFVCRSTDSTKGTPVSCTHCLLTVHPHCYGLGSRELPSKWVCDQCTNDWALTVSTEYKCRLCPVGSISREMWEPPKVSHKKKTDRDREKERLEKELLETAKRAYAKRQSELGRPQEPREALKQTQDNNWVHVTCAVWTPEIKFSDPDALERAEGVGSALLLRADTVCKICKNNTGACVSCQQCHAQFHVSCAQEKDYTFGFDITPLKGSSRKENRWVTLGQESGSMNAAIWCKEHGNPKTIVHAIDEIEAATDRTALQTYALEFKKADQAMTGTARKANLLSVAMSHTSKVNGADAATVGQNRRVSTVSAVAAASGRRGRNSIASVVNRDDDTDTGSPARGAGAQEPDKECATCGINVSPLWFPYERPKAPPPRVNGMSIDALTNSDVKSETGNEIHVIPTQEGATDNQGKTLWQCTKCRHPAKIQKRPIPLAEPRPSLPMHEEWPPATIPPPPQAYPPQVVGWPPHMVHPVAMDGSHLPPHHFPPPMHGQGYAPHPMLMNGSPYGQPPPPGPPQFGAPVAPPFDRPQHPNGPSQLSPSLLPPRPPHFGARGLSDSPFPQHQQQQQQQPPPPPVANHPPPPAQGGHGSPGAHFARPSTPRDASIDPRLSGGASASPGLRNLLN